MTQMRLKLSIFSVKVNFHDSFILKVIGATSCSFRNETLTFSYIPNHTFRSFVFFYNCLIKFSITTTESIFSPWMTFYFLILCLHIIWSIECTEHHFHFMKHIYFYWLSTIVFLPNNKVWKRFIKVIAILFYNLIGLCAISWTTAAVFVDIDASFSIAWLIATNLSFFIVIDDNYITDTDDIVNWW